MRVRWLSRALHDLEEITDYIAMDNPSAALRMVDRVEICTKSLADHPERGRYGRIEGTRELVVAGTPYLVVYRIGDGIIDVLRVLHGAQQWPPTTEA